MSETNRLSVALFITLIIFFAEVVGGLLSNSLALLSDAGHMVTDVFSLGLSLLAVIMAKKPSNGRATYGYQRIGILTALINGLSLVAIALFIFWEAYRRLQIPPTIHTSLMLFVALLGLIANMASAFVLGHKHEDLNIKSAWWHVIGDALSSLGVIIAALIIRFTGWQILDALVSILVGVIIIVGGIRVSREALDIFLELSPGNLDVEKISRKLRAVPGVLDIHDVHLWSIGHKNHAFTAHVRLATETMPEADAIRQEMERELSHLGINHSVLQMECDGCEISDLYCQTLIPDSTKPHQH